MVHLSLRERFWNRFTGKDVDMTPVGTTNTYGVVALMKQCGYERPLADRDPIALTELGYAAHKYAGFEWVKAMGWDITILSEAFGCELGPAQIDVQHCVKSHPYAEKTEELDLSFGLFGTRQVPCLQGKLPTSERESRRSARHFRTLGGSIYMCRLPCRHRRIHEMVSIRNLDKLKELWKLQRRRQLLLPILHLTTARTILCLASQQRDLRF